jgi:RNA polymerase sigma-70 factor (ECF subfamily)
MGPYTSSSPQDVVRACCDSDADAWQEFVSRYYRPIVLSIIRTAKTWGEPPGRIVDDLVQETYLKLCADGCKLLHEFAVHHPDAIAGYLKAIAVNVARDYFKSIHTQKRGLGETTQLLDRVELRAPSKSIGGQGAIEREVLMEQVDQYLKTCTDGPDKQRDRIIFWLYYQQGLTAKGIASLPAIGLTAKGVESALLRLTRLVRQKVMNPGSSPPETSDSAQKGFRRAESY